MPPIDVLTTTRQENPAPPAMAEEEGTQQLPFVRETVLKKRKDNEEWATKNRERKAAKRQRRRHDAKGAIKRPEDFVKEFRNKELDFLRMRTRLKVRNLRPAEAIDAKLLFAIRIPGTADLHPQIRKILARLRLTQVLTGVFLKATEANLKRLAAVGPFVTYGFPNLKNVKELIYKKGRGYFDKEPFPLTSNDLIEKRQEEEKTAINTHVLNKNVVLASLLRQLFSGASEGVMTISAVSTPDAGQMCCAGQQGFGICCFSMCGLIPLNLIAQASMILRSLFAICFL